MNQLVASGKRYSVIYADPPWSYLNGKQKSAKLKGGAERHYGTMTPAEIKALPVAQIAAANALLFIWVTFPLIEQGLETIKAWGFEYKTLGFSWHKVYPNGNPCFGVGWYTRSNSEVCLLGVRGKPWKVSKGVSSAIVAPRGRHSAKPDEVRERIFQFAGDVPRIELFARARVPGWDSWGNEVKEKIDLDIFGDLC